MMVIAVAMLDRPAMNQLRADLKTRAFETIYILNTDRIARDVTYQNIIIGEFLRHKKQIIINGKDYLNNPENKFTLTVLGAVSELERAKTIERITRGRQHRLKHGILLGNGNHIFGYHYVHKTQTSSPSYKVNEEEAKIVRFIFETYAKGEIGIRTISQKLKDMGIKARNRLNQSHLKYIMQNETYTGTKYFNTMTDTNALGLNEHRTKRGKPIHKERSEWIGIKISAIISKELFNKVQKRLEYNQLCYRNSQGTQLLSRLVYCGKCNCRCFAYKRHYKVERKEGIKLYQKAVYRCPSKGWGHNPEIDNRVLESTIVEMIKESIFKPDILTQYITIFNNRRTNKHKIEKQLSNIDDQEKTVAKQKERIIDLYAFGDLDREEYVKRINTYENEIEVIKLKRDDLLKYLPLFQRPEIIENSIRDYCKAAKASFTSCNDFKTKRQFMLDHISKVAYHRVTDKIRKGNDKIRLHGSIPIMFENRTLDLEFKLEKMINRTEWIARIQKMDLQNGNWGGKYIFHAKYNKQLNPAVTI